MPIAPGPGTTMTFPVSGIVFAPPTVGNITYINVPSAAWEIGTPIYDTPFPADPKKYVCRIPYMCKATQHAANTLALDAPGPYGGYHVGESGFRDHVGGIISFWREFAIVPDSRNEYESYVYAYQIAHESSEPDSDSITEIPKSIDSRVQYDYFRANQPETIALGKAPRVININGTNRRINGWGSLVEGQEYLAEDATLRVWKGKIYERKQRFFVAALFSADS